MQVMDPESQAIDILWRDEGAAAVCKPSGMLSHNSTYAGPREVALLQAARDALEQKIWLVQRLDRGTSGLLLVCFDPGAVAGWTEAILEGQKDYLAIVRGRVTDPITIDKALSDHGGSAREAVTHIQPLTVADEDRVSLVRCTLQHGRMHQARRHLNRAAHPVLNDSEHGDTRFNKAFRERWNASRLLLHAERLQLRHPDSGAALDLQCPMPPQMAKLAERLFAWPGK